MKFFKQYIFRSIHHNDLKFTHNIYYMVLFAQEIGGCKFIIDWLDYSNNSIWEPMYISKCVLVSTIVVTWAHMVIRILIRAAHMVETSHQISLHGNDLTHILPNSQTKIAL